MIFLGSSSPQNKHLARLFSIFNLVEVTGSRFSADHFSAHLGRKASSEEK